MNTLVVDFPVGPEAVMPEPLQTIMLWIMALASLGVLIAGIRMARSMNSAVPLLLVAAAGASVPLETIIGFLGHLVHPPIGSMAMFKSVDRVIPWHMALGYVAAFGTVFLTLYYKAHHGGLSPKFVWGTFAASVIFYILLEIYPVHAGLWVYYDHQPLWLWHGMAPLPWSFMNSAAEIMGIALIYLMLPMLTGWRQILILLLGPTGSVMGHLGSGWPIYNIMNSTAAENFWILQLSGLLTVGLTFLVVWISATLLSRPVINLAETNLTDNSNRLEAYQ